MWMPVDRWNPFGIKVSFSGYERRKCFIGDVKWIVEMGLNGEKERGLKRWEFACPEFILSHTHKSASWIVLTFMFVCVDALPVQSCICLFFCSLSSYLLLLRLSHEPLASTANACECECKCRWMRHIHTHNSEVKVDWWEEQRIHTQHTHEEAWSGCIFSFLFFSSLLSTDSHSVVEWKRISLPLLVISSNNHIMYHSYTRKKKKKESSC